MNRTLNLLGLGVAAAIALLLPAQARADVPDSLEDTDSALTSEEPQRSGETGAIAAPSQPAQAPDVGAVESANAKGDPTDDTQASAQADGLGLPLSTNSSDLQAVEPSLASEDDFQVPPAQPLGIAQTPPEPSPSGQWHFVFTPYVYVPFFISGSANFKGTEDFRNNFANSSGSGNLTNPSRDFEFVPSDIRAILQSRFNFAFLGALEAWTPNYTFGILGNVDYVSLTNRETLTRDVRRPGLANFIPSELNAALNTQLWNIDLAASYRFYDRARANPEGLHSEHDLGPFVFDVLGGLSIVSLNNQLGLSTNLGGEGQFSSNRTLISPLIGGRFRWNASPKLAVLLSGTVSGFGLSGLSQYSFRGGVDWMFSGNTTLGAGYRFGFLDYSSSQLDLDINQSGPYLNVGFRF